MRPLERLATVILRKSWFKQKIKILLICWFTETCQVFINETKRIEFLFELYDKYTSGIFAV